MKILNNWKRISSCLGILLLSLGPGISTDLYAKPLHKKEASLDELYSIGRQIIQAMRNRDIDLILSYDRPDLRKLDKEEFEKKADLYCYLFDTSCIHSPNQPRSRSVYDFFRNSKKLNLKVFDLGRWADGSHLAVLLFFDGAVLATPKKLSSDFVCANSGVSLESWTFQTVKGKWESRHPPFDLETDFYCSPD